MKKTWRWYRYASVTYSTFGCEPRNYGLTQERLQTATRRGLEATVDRGVILVDSYPQQKDVYAYGQGKTVDLGEMDNGLVYCFMATDTAGITGYKAARVSQTRAAEEEPETPSSNQQVSTPSQSTPSSSSDSSYDDLPPPISEEIPTTSESTVDVAVAEDVSTGEQTDAGEDTPLEVDSAADSHQEEGKEAAALTLVAPLPATQIKLKLQSLEPQQPKRRRARLTTSRLQTG